MCILFQRDQSVITRHIKYAFEEEGDMPNNMQKICIIFDVNVL